MLLSFTEMRNDLQAMASGTRRRCAIATLFILAMVAVSFLISCGGGGSSGIATTTAGGGETETVSALTLPDRISVTSVDESSNSLQSLSASKKSVRLALSDGGTFYSSQQFDDGGTDYDTQEKDVWVEDTEALSLVNDILGIVQDTGYENFVNVDPYKALVKKVGDSEQSTSGSSTTATTTEELMEITVAVTRENNDSPMLIKVWVVEEDGPGGAAMLIRGHFTVTEGVSIAYPYGKMEAHFSGVELDASGEETDTEVMTMAIKVDADDDGNVIVQCLDQGEEDNGSESFSWSNNFRLVSTSDLGEGQAYVEITDAWDHPGGAGEEEYVGYIAYDTDYFKEKAADSSDVTVYDKNSLHHKVYRYRLFDQESGSKVTLNGGFPITLENGKYGYIGYWGLWVNDGVDVANGDTVFDMDDNEYTVLTVGGKLRKHTRTEITLADLKEVEMAMWDSSTGSDWIIAWNGSAFMKIGYRTDRGQIEYGDYGVAAFENEWDGAWCDALNAHLGLGRLYAEGMPAVTDETTFSYHVEETIDPSNAENWTFYYWGPVAGQSHEAYWSSTPSAAVQLTFNAATLVLSHDGTPQIDTDSSCGFWMGPLTTTEYSQENQWQAHDADVYYSWSTGPNQWDQLTTLVDADNQFVSFDPPLHFSYQHSTGNDLNGDATQNGKMFSLNYDGSELQVPWNYDSGMDEWQPVFNLKDGTVLTDGEGDQYVVKGIEAGVVMREAVDPDDAADLVIDETIEAPTLAYDASKTDLVGEIPDAVLKVIKGELIE